MEVSQNWLLLWNGLFKFVWLLFFGWLLLFLWWINWVLIEYLFHRLRFIDVELIFQFLDFPTHLVRPRSIHFVNIFQFLDSSVHLFKNNLISLQPTFSLLCSSSFLNSTALAVQLWEIESCGSFIGNQNIPL